jgi:UDP-glucose:glycoprotein glucosyltransferase
MQALVDLGFTPTQAVDILSHREVGAASAAPPPPGRGMLSAQHLGELFDASDRPEAVSPSDAPEEPTTAETILYWNDIERDSRYRQWPKSMQALLSPMYPGQMPQIRQNLVNVILALDLGKRDVHTILSENIATFISRGVGIRFGTVPLLKRADLKEGDNVQATVARVMWYLVEKAGRASAIAFSREVRILLRQVRVGA